jgi:hypothetical protein
MKYSILTALLLASTSAHALTIVDHDSDSLAIQMRAPKSDAHVVEIGDRSKVVASVKAGDKVRLGDAIKRIVPKGWAGYSKEADFTKEVSWDEADSWPDALAQMMAASGHDATIDWVKKRVLVVRTLQSQSRALEANPRRQAALIAANGPTGSSAQSQIQIGEKLSEAFIRWGKAVGWQVSWEAPKLVSEFEFSSDKPFEQAVVEVLNALNRNGAQLDHMFFDGNRMLRIMEKK